jgi:hypothetical protein
VRIVGFALPTPSLTTCAVGLRQLFQLLPVVLFEFFPRGFGQARLIHFLLDASECRLVGFLRVSTTLRHMFTEFIEFYFLS